MADPGPMSRRALWMHKLSDEVARGIAEKIRSGVLTVGQPLPDRDALVAEFVTSDGVVDRAVERLAEQGVVTRDAEGGLRVAGYPGREGGFAIPADQATLADVVSVLELRVGIEGEAAALAAQRCSPEDMAAVQAAAEAFETAAADRTTPARADFALHRVIGEASGNRYILELIQYLGPLLIPRMRVAALSAGDPARDENLRRTIAEHRDIVAAIGAGDPSTARRAMRDHLTRTIDLIRDLDAAP